MNLYLRGIICCLIATISWGIMFPIMSDALNYVDPFSFTVLRYSIASGVFVVFLWYREGISSFILKGERWLLAWLFGSLGFAGFGFLVFEGQSLAGKDGALTASIIMATMPMISILVLWVLKKSRIHNSIIIFILLSFIGVVLVLTNGSINTIVGSSKNIVANILIFLGALCWVLYTIGSSYFPHWSVLKYTTLTTLLGLITILFVYLFLIKSNIIILPKFRDLFVVIPHLIYMALIAGLLAVLFWNIGNRIINPVNGVLFMNFVPITSFIISAFNNVIPSNVQIIGAIITILALVLNNLNQRRFLKL